MNKPLISIYGIYKNEENVIERFLSSIKTADEIVLCDTGSLDQTNNIIDTFKKDNPKVNLKTFKIYISPWRFDDARNTSLSFVNPNTDICISLDMDEYLCDNWKDIIINEYDENISLYCHKFKTFWPSGETTEHLHQRIHSRFGYTWKLPVHEILEYSGEEKVKFINEFYIFQKPEKKDTRKNYLYLLEQSVKERNDIWKSWSFLSNEYLSEGKIAEALYALDTAIKIQNSDKAFLYTQKYYIYKFINDIDNACLNLNTAILYLPNRRELYVEKAKFLSEQKKYTEAYFTLLEAERISDKIIDYHYNAFAWGDSFNNFKEKVYELAKKEGFFL